MKKEMKAQVIADLHEKFSRAHVAILTEFSGVPVGEMTELRKLHRSLPCAQERIQGKTFWYLLSSSHS